MRTSLRGLALVAAMIVATDASTQESRMPIGNWQSARSATYTNPALTGAELYLEIKVAKDGSFRGVWGQYHCTAYPGAYGVSIHSCTRTGSNLVSGRFRPGRQGTIDLDKLGRSAFAWNAPSADELAIDLPKNWQGSDAVLYRVRMARDGKQKPTVHSSPVRDEGPLLSANSLYREFARDASTALKRHGGKTLVLEGRRGALVPLSGGGAAIHVPDGRTARALVLVFADEKQVNGIGEGAKFRFRCTLAHFDYQYVYMENCAILRE